MAEITIKLPFFSWLRRSFDRHIPISNPTYDPFQAVNTSSTKQASEIKGRGKAAATVLRDELESQARSIINSASPTQKREHPTQEERAPLEPPPRVPKAKASAKCQNRKDESNARITRTKAATNDSPKNTIKPVTENGKNGKGAGGSRRKTATKDKADPKENKIDRKGQEKTPIAKENDGMGKRSGKKGPYEEDMNPAVSGYQKETSAPSKPSCGTCRGGTTSTTKTGKRSQDSIEDDVDSEKRRKRIVSRFL